MPPDREHADDRFPGAPMLHFSVSADPPGRTIRLKGELDAETGCLLGSVVDGQVAQQHVELVIDVADLVFVDLAGFDALAEVRRRLHDRGGSLTVVGYDALFGDVARFCGLEDLLDGG